MTCCMIVYNTIQLNYSCLVKNIFGCHWLQFPISCYLKLFEAYIPPNIRFFRFLPTYIYTNYPPLYIQLCTSFIFLSLYFQPHSTDFSVLWISNKRAKITICMACCFQKIYINLLNFEQKFPNALKNFCILFIQ